MAKRDKTILIRVTDSERTVLKDRAAIAGKGVSAFLRDSGLGDKPPVQRDQVLAQSPAPAVKEPRVVGAGERSLAERRERRAKQLSTTMPLSNARQLATREIAE